MDQIGFDEIVKSLCRDHRSVRAMVVSAIPELPQAEQWVENLFGGDSQLFSSFIQRHSQNQAWTDGYGIICQVYIVSDLWLQCSTVLIWALSRQLLLWWEGRSKWSGQTTRNKEVKLSSKHLSHASLQMTSKSTNLLYCCSILSLKSNLMLILGLITLESVAGSADLPPLTIGHYYVSGPTPNLTLFHCKFFNPTGLFLFVFLYLLLLAADLIYHL